MIYFSKGEIKMNETLKIIKSRRSNRIFLDEQVEQADLDAILEAGIYAPSAVNGQPWHFTLVQNKDLLDRLSDAFKELAKKSENSYVQNVGKSEKFHVFYNAPTVIFISGEETNPRSEVDCAAATQNMLIQAESLGLGSCWIGFIAYLLNSEEGKELLKELELPEGYRQIHAIALGKKKQNSAVAPKRKEGTINYIK